MWTYTADLNDLDFVLHRQLEIVPTLGQFKAFASLDEGLCDAVVREAYRVAREALGVANERGDRVGCELDEHGGVKTPGFQEAWAAMAQGGWIGLAASPEHGGTGMPLTLEAAVTELHIGANAAFALYAGLTRAASNLLARFAPPELRELACNRLNAGAWAGTMCLTESGAGSDLAEGRTTAVPTDRPGVYEIRGEKIFITGGDQDLTENIAHLVLARVPDSPAGTKGLSIFLVPKFRFDESGAPTGANGVRVASLERKMGIKGSATCSLVFGADEPSLGTLLGHEGEGLRIMFAMMNEARINVGIQGLAAASSAYEQACSYARERLQGRAMKDMGNPESPPIPIVRHPDVRRMLMWQRVHVETMRSLILTTAWRMDLAHHSLDPDEALRSQRLVDFLTPVIKAYCSDKGFEATVLALQTFGGYGYLSEYPVEQLVRDSKIASIYEGTNGIQALDLMGRKLTKDNGVLLEVWLSELDADLDDCRSIPELRTATDALLEARRDASASAEHLKGVAFSGDLEPALLQATPLLRQLGCVALAQQALVQARVAVRRLRDSGPDEVDLLEGKLRNLEFYVANVLPEAEGYARAIQSGDVSCLDERLFV